jgi:histidinol-phosphatase
MHPEYVSRYEVAVAAAQQAGQVARAYFPDAASAAFARSVERKADNSPVTLADRDAEQSLRQSILVRFPHDGFLGEEFGDTPGTSGYRWIVDPIDGTRSFVRGIPLWATLVGLEHQGDLIAGVAVEPVPGNTYRALRGDGAFKNDRRIHVSTVERLGDALACTCDFNFFDQSDRVAAYLALSKAAHRQRGYGDYYGTVLVAQGSAEVMLDYGVKSWDVAGLVAIVEEAGGRLTDWRGGRRFNGPEMLATNGRLHDDTVSLLEANR